MRVVQKSFFALLVMGLFIFSACEDPLPIEQTVVEYAAEQEDLSLLVEALALTNLTGILEGTAVNTVFAPNDEAFQKLLDSNNDWNSLSDIDTDLLNNVVRFHVVSGIIKAADLSNTYVNTLSLGPNNELISLQVNVDNGVVFNGSTSPIDTDIDVSNGVIHTVNEVMLPPNVVGLAGSNGDFSILVAALTRTDLTTDYLAVLNGDGPFTVFAPNNQAFEDLLASNSEWNELGDIPVETLTAVLNYHVVSGANVQADELTDGQTVETLGGDLKVDLSSGAKLTTSSNQSVEIALTDVQGTNGVIHVVSSVLLP